ncbi:MAG: 50S ribosomal protein L18 [Crenarchaeota archaeon]|nr:50S ribosomal protein L18 [Thermoproteota archaeon]MCR8453575.1 50S ribosomal protein L18 [Thermoproteota archaeon]MCR8454782.1 50S ribosomal protein L18 [Thermoproteota archaeon]MCR8462674.1 50S ribosomal protein L18 [Thermoproteota archaeon]MCR8470293.1 50S ribosomal protein L18 [Thermoproteota archaeon]
MKKFGKAYKVPWRRRREGKTDYRARYKMLLSRKIRAVVRKSLRNVIVQFAEGAILGDRTLSYTHSSELRRYGWKYSCGNVPAAYLTGFLAGLKARKANINEAILDIGPQRSTRGNRLYAALKGLIDSGVQIPYDPDILPSAERIVGKHIAEFSRRLKEKDPKRYDRQFSFYLANGIRPEEITNNFIEVLSKIAKEYNTSLPDWIKRVGE